MPLDNAYTVDIAIILPSLQVVDLLVVEHVPEGVGLGLAHVQVGVPLHPFLASPLRHFKGHAGYLLEELAGRELLHEGVIAQQFGEGFFD